MAEHHSGRPPPEVFHTVTDPEQARLLSSSDSLRFLEPFIAREATVKEAAEEVGCKLDTMLYRVRTFLKSGLLEVARVQKRAGRPVKHYRSVADAFFIPFAVTPYAGLEERLEAQMRSRQQEIIRAMAFWSREHRWDGQRIYRNPQGLVWREGAPDLSTRFDPEDPQAPARLDFSTDLHLGHDEAKEVQLELYRLWQRYQASSARNQAGSAGRGRKYALQVTFLPLEPER